MESLLVLRNGQIYSPKYLGKGDILVGGGKILAIRKAISLESNIAFSEIDLKGKKVLPGLIDAHVHIAGAGGEGGPASRTPELKLSDMIKGGVTTVIGCLGTDGFTRTLQAVLMKVKGLRQEGVSAWMLTGSYQVPTPTILGDVAKDIAMIEEIIGVGEIALSDHRSSNPSLDELLKLAGHARVGGMLGGKSGIINIHMGDARDPFKPLYEVSSASEIKLKQFLPTHCNRNSYIFEDAKVYGQKGFIDITASSYPYFPEYEVKPSKAIAGFLEAGVPLNHITMTSDACGSLPSFDENGTLEKLEMGLPKSIFDELKDTVELESIPLESALQVVTSNIADRFWLNKKGRIESGKDADIIVVDNDFQLTHVIGLGKLMMQDGILLQKGSYEQ